jgi:glycosyltransferase involved in cell wall biosynthesis
MSCRVYFDVSGLLHWFAYNTNPSGIQRVYTQILQEPILYRNPNVSLIARCPGSQFFKVPSDLVAGLAAVERIDAVAEMRRLFIAGLQRAAIGAFWNEARVGHLPFALAGLAGMVSRSFERPSPAAGDIIVGLGDFWCYRGHVQALLELKRRSGASLVHMIHDVFPLDQPSWSQPYYGSEFASQFMLLAPEVDRWLVNSRFVGEQLRRQLVRRYGSCRDIDVIPMGWDSFRPGKMQRKRVRSVLTRLGVGSPGYILCVSPIEPRKNVRQLVQAVRRLQLAPGGADVRCVVVGRAGWNAKEVRAFRRGVDSAKGKILWIGSVDDADLSVLYQCARFSVVPSLNEGWGLPVQESLAHGTPCLAMSTGGLKEASLELARYVNPHVTASFDAALREWALDDGAISAARRRLRRTMRSLRLPRWGDAASRVMEICGKMAEKPTAAALDTYDLDRAAGRQTVRLRAPTTMPRRSATGI